jgi:hypothetical protein
VIRSAVNKHQDQSGLPKLQKDISEIDMLLAGFRRKGQFVDGCGVRIVDKGCSLLDGGEWSD